MNEKAELIIESNPDDMGLRARCSLCGTRFDLSGNRLTEKQLLRGLFDLHLRRLHSPAGDDSALDSDEKSECDFDDYAIGASQIRAGRDAVLV